jgi:2-amino-4-hydroxy-6-hydroxymethyldihydropteridine diphosphokinase
LAGEEIMRNIYLLLGSNLGDRKLLLAQAVNLLALGGCQIVKKSSIYESEPWGISQQPNFLNQVIEIEYMASPSDLLSLITDTERLMGRKRVVKWQQRIIDIDILYFSDKQVYTSDLIIPHVAIAERRFTLVPLNEIAPEFIHPGLKYSQRELLKRCADPLQVSVYKD